MPGQSHPISSHSVSGNVSVQEKFTSSEPAPDDIEPPGSPVAIVKSPVLPPANSSLPRDVTLGSRLSVAMPLSGADPKISTVPVPTAPVGNFIESSAGAASYGITRGASGAIEYQIPANASVPAVLLPPDAPLSPVQQAAVDQIIEDFDASLGSESSRNGAVPTTPVSRADWEAQRLTADERYRLLFGDEVHNARTLDAAREGLLAQPSPTP